MEKGLTNIYRTYSGDFKVYAVEYMHTKHLSLPEAAAYFGIPSKHPLDEWERIYYKEGAHALYKENRGRKKDMKLNKSSNLVNTPKETEEDLITEVQRLRAENAYLKKLRALVQERIAQENGEEQEPSKN